MDWRFLTLTGIALDGPYGSGPCPRLSGWGYVWPVLGSGSDSGKLDYGPGWSWLFQNHLARAWLILDLNVLAGPVPAPGWPKPALVGRWKSPEVGLTDLAGFVPFWPVSGQRLVLSDQGFS